MQNLNFTNQCDIDHILIQSGKYSNYYIIIKLLAYTLIISTKYLIFENQNIINYKP